MMIAVVTWAAMPAAAYSKKTLEKAEAGDAEAQYRVGTECFDSGDYESAISWLTKSSEQGNSEAMYFLGYVYYAMGEDANCIKWFEKAADLGHGGAMFNIANCYFNGQGVPADNAKGVEWLRKASQADDPSAINFLGQLYHNGMAVEKDRYQAYLLFKKAAALGDPEAMRRLGIYLTGKYRHKITDMPDPRVEGILDAELGRDMFKQSADAGNAMAQFYFIQHYLENEKKGEDGNPVVDEELIKYMQMSIDNEEMTDEDSRRIICAKLADYYEAELGGLSFDNVIVENLRSRAGDVQNLNARNLELKLTSLDLNNDMTITTQTTEIDGTITKKTAYADGSEKATNYNPADKSINWSSETNPDLTCVKKFSDGRVHVTEVEVKDEDGTNKYYLVYTTKEGDNLLSTFTKYSDGSSTLENSDGSKEITTVQVNDDGSKTYTTVLTLADGTTRTTTTTSSVIIK